MSPGTCANLLRWRRANPPSRAINLDLKLATAYGRATGDVATHRHGWPGPCGSGLLSSMLPSPRTRALAVLVLLTGCSTGESDGQNAAGASGRGGAAAGG